MEINGTVYPTLRIMTDEPDSKTVVHIEMASDDAATQTASAPESTHAPTVAHNDGVVETLCARLHARVKLMYVLIIGMVMVISTVVAIIQGVDDGGRTAAHILDAIKEALAAADAHQSSNTTPPR